MNNLSYKISRVHLTPPSPVIPKGMHHEQGAFSRCRAVKILTLNLSLVILLNKDMVEPLNPYESLLCLI